MILAFDTLTLGSEFDHTGSSVYARNVFSCILNLAPTIPGLKIVGFQSPFNSTEIARLEQLGLISIESRALRLRPWWRTLGATVSSMAARADVLFSPTPKILRTGVLPLVVTIHDTIPNRLSAYLVEKSTYLKAVTAIAAKLATRIVTDSLCSKRDLVEIYRIPAEKIDAVYLGYDRALFNTVAPEPELTYRLIQRFDIRKRFIIHHGRIEARKNLERLVQAYGLLRSKRPTLEVDLVLTGSLGWGHKAILDAAQKVRNSGGNVIVTGPLPGDELAALVKLSFLCVVPSLYEGFCLPMIEAMACGVPTIAANASCLPEVYGNSLLYFDPKSVDDITDKMIRTMEDDELRLRIARAGQERTLQFSWERCAQETLDVLLSAAECSGLEQTGQKVSTLM